MAARKKSADPTTRPAEWVLAAISAFLVLGAIGSLLYEAAGAPSAPPSIEISIDTIFESGTGYTVQIDAHNRGEATAAGLVVEGVLATDTGVAETASITIPYVPARAVRKAGLIFMHDPRRFELRIQPKGYELP